VEKTVKRGRGHKIGPGEAVLAERRNRIELHRQRIDADTNRILKAGFDPHDTPIEEMLEAGVEISNPLYLMETAIRALAECQSELRMQN
jgi:hypothetical protein